MTYIPALEIIGKPRPKKMSPIEAKTKRREYLRKYHKSAKGREALRKADRKRTDKLWSEFMSVYGIKCLCCGERERRFLTIGHLNGDGGIHRKRVGPGQTRTIIDLKKRGWPKDEGISVQCWNCNMATRYHHECPHRGRW